MCGRAMTDEERGILVELERLASEAAEQRRRLEEGDFLARLRLVALVVPWVLWNERALAQERSREFLRRHRAAARRFFAALR